MTIAEIERLVKSKNRVKQAEEKERAAYDYILANLIVRGVQAAITGGEGIPTIYEVYSGLFDDVKEEKEQEKQNKINELSVLRFKQFVSLHNKNFNGGVDLNE